MHLGMQGLDPAVQALDGARVGAHVRDGEACLAEGLGGAARGQELDILGSEELAEVDNTGLVGDTDEGSGDGDDVARGALEKRRELEFSVFSGGIRSSPYPLLLREYAPWLVREKLLLDSHSL